MSDMFQDFSGGEPFEPLPEQQSPAPALPIEAHIVGATLAVEKMKGLCEQMLNDGSVSRHHRRLGPVAGAFLSSRCWMSCQFVVLC